jgi:uncharacterized protein
VDCVAQRSGDDILVTGHIKGRIVAECIRCLEDAVIDVDTQLASLFTARGEGHRPKPEEEDLSPEELAREFYSGEDIVLDEVVRDAIILEVPMQPLCREDCPGIAVPDHVRPPADFGERKSADGVDPRLSGLKALADQLKKE